MNKTLLIIVATCAASSSLLATPLVKQTTLNDPTISTGIPANTSYDKLGLDVSALSPSISTALRDGVILKAGVTLDENVSDSISTPYMNIVKSAVPDGGLTALLLGLGMVGLMLMARRDSVVRKSN